jgi:hypothetical protein
MVLCKVLIVLMEGEYPRMQNVKHQDALVTSSSRGPYHTTVITPQFCCDYSCSRTSQPQKVHQIGLVDEVEDTMCAHIMQSRLKLCHAQPMHRADVNLKRLQYIFAYHGTLLCHGVLCQ